MNNSPLNSNYIVQMILEHIDFVLLECCPIHFISNLKQSTTIKLIQQYVYQDLLAFSRKDPAATNDPMKILVSYNSFKAVMHYRETFARTPQTSS